MPCLMVGSPFNSWGRIEATQIGNAVFLVDAEQQLLQKLLGVFVGLVSISGCIFADGGYLVQARNDEMMNGESAESSRSLDSMQ